MLHIKVNNIKYTIKTISELTTAEFIELTKLENLDVPKYVSWQTGVSIESAFFAKISPTVEKAIGQVPDITKMSVPKWVDKNNLIDTIGQRHQVETSGLEGYELLVFTLAVANAKSVNIDDVRKLHVKYLAMPFTEILPAGFFFFKNLRSGKRNVHTLLKWLLGLIKIKKSKNPQA